MQGYLAIVLHAHLPYIRHPEYDNFLEEMWLFEAISETYIPLLKMLEGLENDGVGYKLLLSLSPTLVSMLEDDLLQHRFILHTQKIISLAEKECERTFGTLEHNVAEFYLNYYLDILYLFRDKYKKKLSSVFNHLSSFGNLELITCGATHGFFPLLQPQVGSVRSQIETALNFHRDVFGIRPEGIWLPECAYYPGLDSLLSMSGVKYTFIDSHGLENASNKPVYGVYAPIYSDNGVAFFARDRETSYQVWSADLGYPGHPDYREFYRDQGFDLPESLLKDFLIDGSIRVNTGLKYRRITGKTDCKELYSPLIAREVAARHADDFLHKRQEQIARLYDTMDRPPLIVAPYDAELFGHWWFEGPWFLDYLFRKIYYDQNTVKTITPREYLTIFSKNQLSQPAGSSWGGDGTYEFWVNSSNEDFIPKLQQAAEQLVIRVRRYEQLLLSYSRSGQVNGEELIIKNILQQMQRELMLAQASDWSFIMRTGTTPTYAYKRFTDHISRFWSLDSMLEGERDTDLLSSIMYADAIFPNCDPLLYL